jgi:hypothetical protein
MDVRAPPWISTKVAVVLDCRPLPEGKVTGNLDAGKAVALIVAASTPDDRISEIEADYSISVVVREPSAFTPVPWCLVELSFYSAANAAAITGLSRGMEVIKLDDLIQGVEIA